MAHNCIVVNLDRCTGCYSCEITCKMENDIALGEHWNKMLQRGPFGDYPNSAAGVAKRTGDAKEGGAHTDTLTFSYEDTTGA